MSVFLGPFSSPKRPWTAVSDHQLIELNSDGKISIANLVVSGDVTATNMTASNKVTGTKSIETVDLDATTINDQTATAITTAVTRSLYRTAGSTLWTWDPQDGNAAWTGDIHGDIVTARYLLNIDQENSTFTWTMGTASTAASVVGKWYRFTFAVTQNTNRGIAEIKIGGVLDSTFNGYSSHEQDTAVATKWYQADDTSLTFTILVSSSTSGNHYFPISNLRIEQLQRMTFT